MLCGTFFFNDTNTTCPIEEAQVLDPYKEVCSNESWAVFTYLIYAICQVGFILNLFCLVVLLKDKKHRNAMRQNLILLSMTEVLFAGLFLLDYILSWAGNNLYNLPEVQPHVFWKARLTQFFIIFSDTLLCSRNWCNVIISASRTEVIVSPLRRRKIFSKNRILILYFFLFVFGFLLNSKRFFNEWFESCLMPETGLKMWYKKQGNNVDFWPFLYFTFQTFLPFVSVILTASLIIYYIAPRSTPASINLPNSSNPVRRRHHRKATHTVLYLAAIFTLFETPTFIFSTLMKYFTFFDDKNEFYTKYIRDNENIYFVTEAFINLDSVCNIIAYSTSVPEIKTKIRVIFCYFCGRCRSKTMLDQKDEKMSNTTPNKNNTTYDTIN